MQDAEHPEPDTCFFVLSLVRIGSRHHLWGGQIGKDKGKSICDSGGGYAFRCNCNRHYGGRTALLRSRQDKIFHAVCDCRRCASVADPSRKAAQDNDYEA